MPESNLQLTSDGSHSVFSEKFQALYHSKHGAIQESMHVFIETGLRYLAQNHVRILEMGFGTGLNALLTLIETQNSDLSVEYQTVEAYPMDVSAVKRLNYLSILQREDLTAGFTQLHTASAGKKIQLGNFSFKKQHVKLEDAHFDQRFDLVFYDAFAPATQAELWTSEIFTHIGKFLNPGAILVSYCAKGSFKRALQAAGFTVEKVPGPPGKREMIRASFRT